MKTTLYLTQYARSFFLDYLICRCNMSSATVKSYRDAMKLFFQFVMLKTKKSPAKLLVTDITESMVIDFLAHLEKERGNSIQTRNHRLTTLRRLFEYISLHEPLLSDNCRTILNIPLKRRAEYIEIKYLEKDEITSIFNVINTKTTLGRRDYAMLLFMYNTGARVQETADARLSWISFNNPYKVEILGKGNKWRTCPLWKSTVEMIQKITSERSEKAEKDRLFLNRFGQPLSRFGILDIVAKYKEKAASNTPTLKAKKVTPHTIRHTTAMHLLQSGVDINVIRSWLGHVKLSTTHRYAEIDLAMKEKALKTCEITNSHIKDAHWRSNPETLSWLESL